ncbi:hypothetical protein EJ06DRAFT_557974 [Trichodelitschia bisporula]|uniref:Uncharacterized protein n=1 Tax=Trichodelitschia bisporula TaxID=703511 RepID=A0A6G1HS12_9PEZI|nr:hypothetical protein EJ06DRAFT_557974 [Trichodelitschia bisporula]
MMELTSPSEVGHSPLRLRRRTVPRPPKPEKTLSHTTIYNTEVNRGNSVPASWRVEEMRSGFKCDFTTTKDEESKPDIKKKGIQQKRVTWAENLVEFEPDRDAENQLIKNTTKTVVEQSLPLGLGTACSDEDMGEAVSEAEEECVDVESELIGIAGMILV